MAALIFIVAGGIATYYLLPRPPRVPLVNVVKSISFDGGAGGNDWAVGMFYDETNHLLFVSGCITVPGQGKDIFLAKYDEDLNQIKNTTFQGAGQNDDVGYVLTLGDPGMLYVIGYVNVTNHRNDIWIAKYNYDLVVQKYTLIDGKAHGTDDGYGIIYRAGYLYVAGTVTEPDGGYNLFVAKYDTDLNQIKNYTFNGAGDGTDKARFLTFGPDGTLYVSGSICQPDTGVDIWLGHFTTDLDLLDEAVVPGPMPGAEDKGFGLAFDSLGNLYTVGMKTESGQGTNLWLGKFDSDLNLLDNVTFDGPAHGEDVAYDFVMLSDNVLLVAGVYSETLGGPNAYLAEYTSDFRIITSYTKDGSAHDYDVAYGPIWGPGGDIYVSGFLTEVSEGQNGWLTRIRV
ncbi:MAG: hypothetical protein WED04_09535 [Promethearchaeati archaeon SRVP18_Atabeyarchaeia-1]